MSEIIDQIKGQEFFTAMGITAMLEHCEGNIIHTAKALNYSYEDFKEVVRYLKRNGHLAGHEFSDTSHVKTAVALLT